MGTSRQPDHRGRVSLVFPFSDSPSRRGGLGSTRAPIHREPDVGIRSGTGPTHGGRSAAYQDANGARVEPSPPSPASPPRMGRDGAPLQGLGRSDFETLGDAQGWYGAGLWPSERKGIRRSDVQRSPSPTHRFAFLPAHPFSRLPVFGSSSPTRRATIHRPRVSRVHPDRHQFEIRLGVGIDDRNQHVIRFVMDEHLGIITPAGQRDPGGTGDQLPARIV